MILAHMGDDMELDGGPRCRQAAQGAARAEGVIADPLDVDHHRVVEDLVEPPPELGDHRPATAWPAAQRSRVWT